MDVVWFLRVLVPCLQMISHPTIAASTHYQVSPFRLLLLLIRRPLGDKTEQCSRHCPLTDNYSWRFLNIDYCWCCCWMFMGWEKSRELFSKILKFIHSSAIDFSCISYLSTDARTRFLLLLYSYIYMRMKHKKSRAKAISKYLNFLCKNGVIFYLSAELIAHTKRALHLQQETHSMDFFVYIFVVVISKKVRKIRERKREKEMSEWEGKSVFMW